MNCCVNCFCDPGLKNRIIAASTHAGDCDFCGTVNINLIGCDVLGTHFDPLFDLYVNHPDANRSLHIASPFLLHEHLEKYWNKLFNNELLNDRGIKQLVNQIGRGSSFYSDQLFEQPVEYAILVGTATMPAENLQLKWDSFSKEIKETNRFFLSEVIDLDTLDSVFSRLVVNYPVDTEFYRARISDELLPPIKLGKPPAVFTTPGRANPVGIPYLYVSESERTTLYETRIALHEGISIGKFICREPLNLVSLKGIADYGPFEILDRGFTLDEFIQFRPYLIKIGNELSKPVRKQDVNLDYLPTQYLCEYIKSKLGFDAVEYKSAMNPYGYNLAIFNDAKLECVETKYYTVSDLNYQWIEST